jgi:tetratricopeptide (TPR) repeat protein
LTGDPAASDQALKRQLIEVGDSAFDEGDYMRALDNYHRASLVDHGDAAVWTALGLTFNNLDFSREAWRSYLLALSVEPNRADALWYASEFLFQLEDLALADLFLSRYIEVEQDAERLQEARQLQQEIHAEAESRGIQLSADRADEAEALLENSDGSTVAEQIDAAGQAEEEDEITMEDILLSDEELETEALAGERFIPPLSLKLNGFESTCSHCGLQIPADAPYCWSCRMIHFYE